ncbi:MAG: hypothetical protein MJE77_24215 [Proteobacteria bacterium]|nr:hypothetical protein [Pseudomonadota bacterium]
MLVAMFGACDLKPPPTIIRGYLVGSQPIDGATVKVFELGENGEPVDLIPDKHGIPNSDKDSRFPAAVTVNGEFEINVGDFSGPFVLQATGGKIQEFWHEAPRFLPEDPHTHIVIKDWYAEDYETITMSPLTEIAYQLARARHQNGSESDFLQSMVESTRIIEEHVHMYSEQWLYSISRTRPSHRMKNSKPEDRYSVVLYALASVARKWESDLTIGPMTSLDVSACLGQDLLSSRARLDGQVAAAGKCRKLDMHTFSAGMVQSISIEYLRSEYNTQNIEFWQYGEFLGLLAESHQSELWPIDRVPASLDIEPPVAVVLEVREQSSDQAIIDLYVQDDVTGISMRHATQKGVQAYIPDNPLLPKATVEFRDFWERDYLFTISVPMRLLGNSRTVAIDVRDQRDNRAELIFVEID